MKLLILLLLVSCSSFEYNNPLDKESSSFQSELLEDDDNDNILNYEDDDDNDGVKNYRDINSEFYNEYFNTKEEEILVAKASTNKENDGTLNIDFRGVYEGERYSAVLERVDFYMSFKTNGDIINLEFDFDGDGVYDEKFQTEFVSKSYTYKTPGIKVAVAKVVDEFGNVAKDTVKTFVYNIDSDESTERPTIILEGDETVYLEEGEEYQEPGYSVEDDMYTDNELAEFVYIEKEDNMVYKKVGEYTVRYTVFDKDGNRATAERKVIIQ